MKLIVGLGNPGTQYERTRHNAGFMALDGLARRHGAGAMPKARFHAVTLDASIGGEKVLLVKPTTFMNRSGQSVGEAVRFFKVDPGQDLLVVVDEVALPVGHIRLREQGSPGGHNGLADIDRALGGAAYPRLRIGVGQTPGGWVKADWVLSRFTDEEAGEVRSSIDLATDACEMVVKEGLSAAMNRFNKKISRDQPRDQPGDRPRDQPGGNAAEAPENPEPSTNH
jgi:PTH1 family peptidyl-tRNA hydrolase